MYYKEMCVGTLITCSTGLTVLLYKLTLHWGWGDGGNWHAYKWPLSACSEYYLLMKLFPVA